MPSISYNYDMDMNVQLNSHQLDLLSKYFADLSKILIASTVIAYFVPTGIGPITISMFLIGAITAGGFIVLSVQLAK